MTLADKIETLDDNQENQAQFNLKNQQRFLFYRLVNWINISF